jgi:hypothetical protein
MALSESCTRQLALAMKSVPKTEADADALENAHASDADRKAAHASVAEHTKFLLKIVVELPNVAPITGKTERDLRVVNTLSTLDWGTVHVQDLRHRALAVGAGRADRLHDADVDMVFSVWLLGERLTSTNWIIRRRFFSPKPRPWRASQMSPHRGDDLRPVLRAAAGEDVLGAGAFQSRESASDDVAPRPSVAGGFRPGRCFRGSQTTAVACH